MKKKTLWLVQTAMMLALLIVMQTLTKPAGQLVTGTLVNTVLGISAMYLGVGSGITVALVSPVVAFLLGIAPQMLTVPAIMAGNLVLVLILGLWQRNSGNILVDILCCVCAAAAKFAVLYTLVVWGICHILADGLMEAGLLKAPMLKVLPATFTWPQLITALLGSAIALCITRLLQEALRPRS